MKLPVILTAALAVTLLSFGAHAAERAGTSFKATEGSGQSAGLVWRCGKNPASWGTFGNGCLKQKRKAKKK